MNQIVPRIVVAGTALAVGVIYKTHLNSTEKKVASTAGYGIRNLRMELAQAERNKMFCEIEAKQKHFD